MRIWLLQSKDNLGWSDLPQTPLLHWLTNSAKPLEERKGGSMKIMNFQECQLSTQCQYKVNRLPTSLISTNRENQLERISPEGISPIWRT